MLTVIAETGNHFADFAPYVAAIAADGHIAFQARLRDGRTGVFVGAVGAPPAPRALAGGPECAAFCSHPAIDRDGALSVYGEFADGGQGVFLVRDGALHAVARTGPEWRAVGPLGPTMNDQGLVAFRADTADGAAAIVIGDADTQHTIADTRDAFTAFQGLPVIDADGTVIFRADRRGGGQGIYAARHGPPHAVIETGDAFAALGHFPACNDAGAIAFNATFACGGAGVFALAGGCIATVADTHDGFESFRGAQINNAGAVIFYATPPHGTLGLYRGPGAGAGRVLVVGQPLYGSTLAEFALNPVSFNDRGQIAIRLRLADERQLIVRADP